MASSLPDEPIYDPDERAKPGFVRVSIKIPHLKVKTQWDTSGLIPNFKKVPANATVEVSIIDKWSFSVTVTGDKSMQNKCYKLNIRKLPKPIDRSQTYDEVKEGRVLVFLKKETEESWYPELEQGLDMYESENSGDEG